MLDELAELIGKCTEDVALRWFQPELEVAAACAPERRAAPHDDQASFCMVAQSPWACSRETSDSAF